MFNEAYYEGTERNNKTSALTASPRVEKLTAGRQTAKKANFRSSNTYWNVSWAGLGGFDVLLKFGLPMYQPTSTVCRDDGTFWIPKLK